MSRQFSVRGETVRAVDHDDAAERWLRRHFRRDLGSRSLSPHVERDGWDDEDRCHYVGTGYRRVRASRRDRGGWAEVPGIWIPFTVRELAAALDTKGGLDG